MPYRTPSERDDADAPRAKPTSTRARLAARLLACAVLVWTGMLGCGFASDFESQTARWRGALIAAWCISATLVPAGFGLGLVAALNRDDDA
jgi:hypothetical protein